MRDSAVEFVVMAPGEMLDDAVARHEPDVVLVDMERPDRDALEGLRELGRSRPRPIVLFVDEDDAAFMEEAIAAGVVSYNVGGVPRGDVKPVLRAAVALFREHQAVRLALTQAEERLQTRRLVEKAKRILTTEQHLSEPAAHRWLQRQAMQSGKSLQEVALGIVERQMSKGSP